MNMLAFCTALGLLISQPPSSIARPPEDKAPLVRMTAVQAKSEGRDKPEIPDNLKGVRGVLKSLSADTFALIAEQEREAPLGEETLVPINGVYSLYVTPNRASAQEPMKIQARIEMLEGDGYRNALVTEAQAQPGKALVFRGLPLNVGELVVIMQLAQDGDGESQQSQSDQNEAQEEQEQEKQEQQQGEGERQEGEEQQQQQQKEAQEATQEGESTVEGEEELEDMETIEAILQTLEEQDRREQEEMQNRRTRIRMDGGWW